MEIYGIIYKIRNKVNNKVYIGQTIRIGGFDERYHNDLEKNTHNKHLKNAIKKYGIENFEIDKQFDVAYSKEELDKLEDMYIKLYKTTNSKYGYNKKSGGAKGRPNDETKKKLSEAHKDTQKGESHPMFGKHHKKESLKKMSESHKGKHLSEKTKKKLSEARKGELNYWYGKQFSEEHKQKLSESSKGKNSGENHYLSKKVVCLNTGEIFKTIREANEKYNIGDSSISRCCQGRAKSAGKLPDGTKLVWKYYEEAVA